MLPIDIFFEKFTSIQPGENEGSDNHGVDVYFTRLSLSGLEEMHRYSKDERLYEFFEFEPFKLIDETKAYIEKLLDRMSGDQLECKAMYWFVRRISDDYLVGTAGLVNLNYSRQSVEIGYGIDPELWGKGYVLQIQEILKKFTFEVLELNRISGITMIENDRTIQSVISAGMKHEGVLKDYYCKNDIYHDGWMYGMTAKDYFELQKVEHPVLMPMFSKQDVIEIVSSVLTDEEIDELASMENTFSWDSLNHMQVIMALKYELLVDIKPADIAKMTSIQKIITELNGVSDFNE